jgi:hypothetical protein
METIAASIRMEPLRQAMVKSTGIAMSSVPKKLNSIGGSNSSSIVYAPNVTIQGGGSGSKAEFMNILREHKYEIMKMIDEANSRKQRLSYS